MKFVMFSKKKKKKKKELHRSIISELIDSEICAYLNASQGFFLKPLGQ